MKRTIANKLNDYKHLKPPGSEFLPRLVMIRRAVIDDDDYYPCDNCDNLCDEWEQQYCCELCRYYGGGDEMECAHCDPMNI